MRRPKRPPAREKTCFGAKSAKRSTSTRVRTQYRRASSMTDQKLVHDWNGVGHPGPLTSKRVYLNDETLRDGLQSPTVCDPCIDDKVHLLHLMEDLGIDMLDIGLPGAGPRAYDDVLALAKEIAKSRLRIRPNCAARTTIKDIE